MSDRETDRGVQQALKERGSLPEHIAIIMDGNGRWASERGQARVQGHRAGARSVRDVTEACAELGVRYLTLYTFSTENWQRPAHEVQALMQLLIRTLRKEAATFHENRIRLQSIGDRSHLPEEARTELEEVIRTTADHERMTLTLALSYSGRWELVDAVRKISRRVQSGDLDPADIDENLMARTLSGGILPEPDLLIRTGGEKRISNFLLWQIAYTELYFTEVFWPDFRRNHLYKAIGDYQDRERRFGRIAVQK